jgi:hypothetical protein
MEAPDLEVLEGLLSERLMAVLNTALEPEEPLLRSVFNLIDDSEDPTPRALPAAGILHDEESWNADEILGEAVSKGGRERWKIVLLYPRPTRESGMRGKRGAYTGSKLVIEDLDGWQILAGCPISVDRRTRFAPRDANGELAPLTGYVLEISHEVDYET